MYMMWRSSYRKNTPQFQLQCSQSILEPQSGGKKGGIQDQSCEATQS